MSAETDEAIGAFVGGAQTELRTLAWLLTGDRHRAGLQRRGQSRSALRDEEHDGVERGPEHSVHPVHIDVREQ
jgi:hypothetical protein